MPQDGHPRIAAVLLDDVTALLRAGIIHSDDPAHLGSNIRNDIKYLFRHAVTGNDNRDAWGKGNGHLAVHPVAGNGKAHQREDNFNHGLGQPCELQTQVLGAYDNQARADESE